MSKGPEASKLVTSKFKCCCQAHASAIKSEAEKDTSDHSSALFDSILLLDLLLALVSSAEKALAFDAQVAPNSAQTALIQFVLRNVLLTRLAWQGQSTPSRFGCCNGRKPKSLGECKFSTQRRQSGTCNQYAMLDDKVGIADALAKDKDHLAHGTLNLEIFRVIL